MSLPQETGSSPGPGYTKLHLVLSALFGAALVVLLYASGIMATVARSASRSLGGGSELTTLEGYRYQETQQVRAIVAEVASQLKKPKWQVTAEDLQKNPKIKELQLDTPQSAMTLQSALMPPAPNEAEPAKLEGYKPVDFSDHNSKVYNYAVLKQATPAPGAVTPPETNFVPFGEEYANKKLFVYRLEITRKPTKGPDGKMMPGAPAQTVYFGPVEQSEIDKQIDMVKTQVEVKKLPIEGMKETSVPARFYANAEGKLALVIEGAVPHPQRIVNRGPVAYYDIPASELKSYMSAREKDPSKPMPPSEQAVIAVRKA